MECIEARALKSSALSEMGVKNNVFNYNDDVWCLTEINNSDENFPVEDLLNLDFHEKEIQEEGLGLDEEDDEEEEKGAQETNSNHSSTTTFSGGADEFDSLSAAGELAVPADDLENLEWLSQFVDDSTAGLSLLCPVGNLTVVNPGKRIDPATRPSRKFRVPFLPSPVPRKPRTNCPARPNRRRPWFLSLPPSTAVAESSAATTSSNGSSPLPPLLFLKKPGGPEPDWFRSVENPPAKKQRRPPEADSGRRCTHCQVNRTPQWRTGPLGPKTLCNACGVRYKSGRLFPEYRPACSPTFSKEMHSNSHRKVLEMRRKKDVAQGF